MNKESKMAYDSVLAKRKAKRDELIHKFFKREPLNWVRKRGNYYYSTEEAYLAIDYYIETGVEP
jgi:hypothetical protein